jgi:RNA polymerase sigma factor (sigma-70 family)
MDTVTSATLLEAIKDGQDGRAWGRFISRYRPMIVSFAKTLGLDSSDSEDVGQETLLQFLKIYREGRYNREKGKLRSWLFTIANRKMHDIQRKKMKELVIGDQTGVSGMMVKLESPDEMKERWEEEWQRSILRACMEEAAREVSPQTLAAFECYVLKRWPVEKVAQHLEISANTVYLAKNRVLSLMRKTRMEMEEI